MPMAKARRVQVYLDPVLHDRLVAEITARRGDSLSSVVSGILADHFALLDELAHALQPATAPGEPKQGRIIHTLLAETEGRLGDAVDQQTRRISGVRGELAELRTMIDRLAFSLLVHLPEVPEATRDAALSSANVRHGKWRRAVEKLMEDGGVAPLRIKT